MTEQMHSGRYGWQGDGRDVAESGGDVCPP